MKVCIVCKEEFPEESIRSQQSKTENEELQRLLLE